MTFTFQIFESVVAQALVVPVSFADEAAAREHIEGIFASRRVAGLQTYRVELLRDGRWIDELGGQGWASVINVKVTFRNRGKAHRGILMNGKSLVALCRCPGSQNGRLTNGAVIIGKGHALVNCEG